MDSKLAYSRMLSARDKKKVGCMYANTDANIQIHQPPMNLFFADSTNNHAKWLSLHRNMKSHKMRPKKHPTSINHFATFPHDTCIYPSVTSGSKKKVPATLFFDYTPHILQNRKIIFCNMNCLKTPSRGWRF